MVQASAPTKKDFLSKWMDGKQDVAFSNVWVYRERAGLRKVVLPTVQTVILDHLVGLNIIEKIGGYKKAAKFIRNRLPTSKKMRSADFGEILAAEYVDQLTDFYIPLKKLRHSDDRAVAMRGDDVIGLRKKNSKYRLLKIEAKSRISLSYTVVKSASVALMKNSGRPNPATLAFMSHQLRLMGDDALAEIIETVQNSDIDEARVEHLVFTCSGNEPATALKAHAVSPNPKIKRELVGVVVVDHQSLIQSIFEALNG